MYVRKNEMVILLKGLEALIRTAQQNSYDLDHCTQPDDKVVERSQAEKKKVRDLSKMYTRLSGTKPILLKEEDMQYNFKNSWEYYGR